MPPCDEERTVTISLPNLDATLMDEVLTDMQVSIIYRDGKLVSQRRIREEEITRIKQNYARKAVKKIAAKKGWTVKETASDSLELER